MLCTDMDSEKRTNICDDNVTVDNVVSVDIGRCIDGVFGIFDIGGIESVGIFGIFDNNGIDGIFRNSGNGGNVTIFGIFECCGCEGFCFFAG